MDQRVFPARQLASFCGRYVVSRHGFARTCDALRNAVQYDLTKNDAKILFKLEKKQDVKMVQILSIQHFQMLNFWTFEPSNKTEF